jgi:hypothetical protein
VGGADARDAGAARQKRKIPLKRKAFASGGYRMDRGTLQEYNSRMPQLHVLDNPFPRRVRRLSGGRYARKAAEAISRWVSSLWFTFFPWMRPPNGQGPVPPLAKGAALSEGAVLSENTNAVSRRKSA